MNGMKNQTVHTSTNLYGNILSNAKSTWQIALKNERCINYTRGMDGLVASLSFDLTMFYLSNNPLGRPDNFQIHFRF